MKIIIAGATGDIGKAIASQLDKQGHDLLLLYRNQQKLAQLLPDLNQSPKFCSLNPINPASLKREWQTFGPEVFITAIGSGTYAKLENIGLDQLDQAYLDNFKLNFILIQIAYKIFKRRKKGYFILINSVSGLEGFPYGASYCSFKFALRGLAEVLAKEGKRYNIRTSSIYPGIVKSNMLHKMPFIPKEKDCILPLDVAKAVTYLLNLPANLEVKDLVLKNSHLTWKQNHNLDQNN